MQQQCFVRGKKKKTTQVGTPDDSRRHKGAKFDKYVGLTRKPPHRGGLGGATAMCVLREWPQNEKKKFN